MIRQIWQCTGCSSKILIEASIRPTLSQVNVQCPCEGFNRFKFLRTL